MRPSGVKDHHQDLKAWFATHDAITLKLSAERFRRRLLLWLIPIAIFCWLWVVPWISREVHHHREKLHWDLSACGNTSYEAEIRSQGLEVQAFDFYSFDASHHRPIGEKKFIPFDDPPFEVPYGQTVSLITAVMCPLLFQHLRRRRYLRFDKDGMLISESLKPGIGTAEFIAWPRIECIRLGSYELNVRIEDGRCVPFKWSQALTTTKPAILVDAVRRHAPHARFVWDHLRGETVAHVS